MWLGDEGRETQCMERERWCYGWTCSLDTTVTMLLGLFQLFFIRNAPSKRALVMCCVCGYVYVWCMKGQRDYINHCDHLTQLALSHTTLVLTLCNVLSGTILCWRQVIHPTVLFSCLFLLIRTTVMPYSLIAWCTSCSYAYHSTHSTQSTFFWHHCIWSCSRNTPTFVWTTHCI